MSTRAVGVAQRRSDRDGDTDGTTTSSRAKSGSAGRTGAEAATSLLFVTETSAKTMQAPTFSWSPVVNPAA